jgi:CspA family cold shock protein
VWATYLWPYPDERKGAQFRGVEGDEGMATGTVKCLNAAKGFGFIVPDDGSVEVFVHYTAVLSGTYWTLQQKQRVRFIPVRGEKGPQAERVQPL